MNRRRYHPLPPLFVGVRPIPPDEIARAFEGHDHIAAQRKFVVSPPISRIEWIIFVCGVSGAAIFGWFL